jgi:hypothetical protein
LILNTAGWTKSKRQIIASAVHKGQNMIGMCKYTVRGKIGNGREKRKKMKRHAERIRYKIRECKRRK